MGAYSTSLKMGRLVVIAILLATTAVFAQDVIDIKDACVQPPPNSPVKIEKICFGFMLDSCKQALSVRLSYGNDSVVNMTINNLQNYETCQDLGGAGGVCQQCLKFSRPPVIEPTYVEACPQTFTRCKIGPTPITIGSRNLDCISYGTKCSSARSCGECLALSTAINTGCGWCGSSWDKGTCVGKSASGPFCRECNSPSMWLADSASCPNAKLSAELSAGQWMHEHPGETAAIFIGAFFALFFLIVIIVCVHGRFCDKSRAGGSGGDYVPPNFTEAGTTTTTAGGVGGAEDSVIHNNDDPSQQHSIGDLMLTAVPLSDGPADDDGGGGGGAGAGRGSVISMTVRNKQADADKNGSTSTAAAGSDSIGDLMPTSGAGGIN